MTESVSPAKYLTTAEAAEYLRLSTGTLENYRCSGIGPQFIQRIPRGKVFYDRERLDAWREGQVKQSTSTT